MFETLVRLALDAERAELGISIAELARRCNLDPSNLAKVLNAKRTLHLHHVDSISFALRPEIPHPAMWILNKHRGISDAS